MYGVRDMGNARLTTKEIIELHNRIENRYYDIIDEIRRLGSGNEFKIESETIRAIITQELLRNIWAKLCLILNNFRSMIAKKNIRELYCHTSCFVYPPWVITRLIIFQKFHPLVELLYRGYDAVEILRISAQIVASTSIESKLLKFVIFILTKF